MKKTVYKVLAWRLISILITLVSVWFWTGDIKEATGFTLVLHFVLTMSHYVFEKTWESGVLKNEKNQ